MPAGFERLNLYMNIARMNMAANYLCFGLYGCDPELNLVSAMIG
jgi:hypothetical protein